MSPAIKVENLSKAYQLGEIGTGTISRDLERWYARIRGKEDPFLRIGETNDRSTKGSSDIVWSLKDINFEIEQGDAVGIIGRNGAGKSTLLKILSKVTAPTSGKITGKGRIASLLEVGTGFHPELSGRENIFLNGAILGMRKKEISRKMDEIVDFAGIERYLDTPVKRYSSGMYVRLAFAVAAHLESEILIVDEVLAVGDAEFQKKCLSKMGDISKGEGRTVLFVSHNMASINALCNKGILLKNGELSKTSLIKEVIKDYLQSDYKDNNNSLEFNEQRSGNRSVIFTKFNIKNSSLEKVNEVLTGDDIILSFDIKVNQENCNVNLGFSLHDYYDNIYSVLYSSYQNQNFQIQMPGYYTINVLLRDISFTPQKLMVFGRLENNNEEADWLQIPLGELQVNKGNFYGTGSTGFTDETQILIKGEWELKAR